MRFQRGKTSLFAASLRRRAGRRIPPAIPAPARGVLPGASGPSVAGQPVFGLLTAASSGRNCCCSVAAYPTPFQLAPLSIEPLDLADQRPPIQFAEALEHGQFGETGFALLRPRSCPFQDAYALQERRAPRLQAAVRAQRVDLPLVGPTQHVSRTVADAVAVVLLMPFASALDLACAGDGLRFAPELIQRVATDVVEARRDFGIQPCVELRFRLDRDLVH